MKISINTLLSAVREEMDYLVDFLNNHPLKPPGCKILANQECADIDVLYGPEGTPAASDFTIPAQRLVFSDAKASHTDLIPNQYNFAGKPLYSLEKRPVPPQPFLKQKRFQFDLLETIFYHISRLEEHQVRPQSRNASGWLTEERHFLVRHGLEKVPVVDHLVAAFYAAVTGRQSEPKRTTYTLTHDLDIIYRFTPSYKFFRSVAANLYYQRGLTQLRKDLRHFHQMIFQGAKDPYDCFDWLFSSSGSWNKKVLYIMTGGNSKQDNKYRWNSNALTKVIGAAREKGYDIGLHPSFNAGMEEEMFCNEKKRLQLISPDFSGLSRQHWLRFDWETTPDILEKNQVLEDSSLGFNHRLGFRCGTGFPYQPFDLSKKRPCKWTEVPLVLMESAAIHESRDTGANVTQLIKGFLEANAIGTHITINFHNSNFDPTLVIGRELASLYQNYVLKIAAAKDSTEE